MIVDQTRTSSKLKHRVNYLEERVDLDGGLGDAGKRALGTLASAPQSPERAGILRDVEFCLPLEFVLEMLEKGIIEVLSSKVSIASSCLDGEYASADVQQRDIECSSTEIKDENVTFSFRFLVQAIGDGSGCGLIDDT